MTDVFPASPVSFDPNTGPTSLNEGGVMFPVVDHVFNAEVYADTFMKAIDNFGSPMTFVTELAKSVSVGNTPPEMQRFSKLSLMPDGYNQGVVQFPGFPPEMLKKIAEDHLIPKVLIQQRVADVMRYAGHSTQPWKPGWTIEMREGDETPDDSTKQDMRDAKAFLQNCSSEVKNARDRDGHKLKPLRNFLSALVRDTFTYDAVAIWTDCAVDGAVRAFKCLPAGQVRLTGDEGYKGRKDIFAVGLNDGGHVQFEFTRAQLVYAIRNERSDADVGGYGYSELEMVARIIQAFTNAFDMNADVFNKAAIPNGLLMASGNWTQRQLDVLSRIWANLKRGTSKSWVLPVMPLPKDGELKILDLSRMKENDVYYQDFINMLAGLYCAVLCFPVDRIGYRISGKGPDTSPKDSQTGAVLVDQADPGLAPLLDFIETHVNEYLIWSRWPHLQMRFMGKNPKEDARAYEAHVLTCTWDEKRALTDKAPLAEGAKGKYKQMMELMGLAPVDPNLSGIYQSVVATLFGQKEEPEKPGNPMTSKRDPAKSEHHGHTSGVRRDSKSETKKAEPATLYVSRPLLNAEEFLDWAHDQGFGPTVQPEELHVTVAFSRTPVNWNSVPGSVDSLEVQGGKREVKALGDKGAVVLTFPSRALQNRWSDLRDLGASWDYDSYHPHVTITYTGANVDLANVEPYSGPLIFGNEVFAPVDDHWVDKIVEKGIAS